MTQSDAFCVNPQRPCGRYIDQPSKLTAHGSCRIEDASTQLCAAADAGDMRQLTRLAENGVDVNAQDYDGRTALHIAARNGTLSAVEFLVSHKANINATDRWTQLQTWQCRPFHSDQVVLYLLAAVLLYT